MVVVAEMNSGNRRFVVATHGHCFDGLCSAVVFSHLARELSGAADFEYVACGYGPGQNGVDPAKLVGIDNAILDYRFSASDKLTWYFDHHVSAFPTDGERTAYAASAGETPRRFFHDGAYSSCTKLIADIAASSFGLDFSRFDELVRWADIIDSARFPSAEMAVARAEPALQLMTVVEHQGDDAFLTRMVPRLSHASLEEVATAKDIQLAYQPLRDQNSRFVDLVKANASERGPVVLVDLLHEKIDVATKFVTYALYPDRAYSVVLTRARDKAKISVGYNPWCKAPRTHDIAQICEKYGGGGHPVVGAVSLKPDDTGAVRSIAAEIVAALEAPAAGR